MKIRKIIFATGNAGKMKEIREIMQDLPLEVHSIREEGIRLDVEENGQTFEENAGIKASAAAKLNADPEAVVMADDSGLEIDFLGGAPGVHSARFMGEDTSYRIKNNAILEKLKDVPPEKRTARFVCVIAAILPDGSVLTTRGTIEGKIGYEERGGGGFGYDPIFYLPDLSISTAELSPEDKNRISHRGKALRAMEAELRKRIG